MLGVYTYKDLDLPLALHLLNKKNALLLDIRTPEEYCRGHLCGATLIPTPKPPLTFDQELQLKDTLWYVLQATDKERPVVIYCKKGIRARKAKTILQQLGFSYVTVLGGVEVEPLKQVTEQKNKVWPICFCNNNTSLLFLP